jgi:hypothetical protein
MSDWGASRLTSRQALSYILIPSTENDLHNVWRQHQEQKIRSHEIYLRREWNAFLIQEDWLDLSAWIISRLNFQVRITKIFSIENLFIHVLTHAINGQCSCCRNISIPNWLSDSSSLIVMVSRWILKTSLQRLRNIPKGFSDNLTFADSRSDYDVKSCLPTRRW